MPMCPITLLVCLADKSSEGPEQSCAKTGPDADKTFAIGQRADFVDQHLADKDLN